MALYTPTFRKNYDMSVYDLHTDALLNTLRTRFDGEWYLLMRLHPHLMNQTGCFCYSDQALQATDYDDVQELLCAADVLISDFSAIMVDYLITKRPCFLYTPDYAEYTANDRNLYFDIKALPFAGFEHQDQLMEHIRSFSEEDYTKKINEFLDKIGSYEDGKASRRVYKIMKGE